MSFGRAASRLLDLAVFFFIPLAFYRGSSDQFANPKLFLTEILVLVAAVALVLRFIWRKEDAPTLQTPLLFLVVAVVLSSGLSSHRWLSVREAGYFLCGPVWALVLMRSKSGAERMLWISGAVAAAAAIVGAILLIQWAGYDPMLGEGYRIDFGTMRSVMRRYSTFGNPNLVAGYLGGAVFLSTALMAAARKSLSKVFAAAASLVALVAIVGSDSQGAWLGLIVGACIAIFVWSPRLSPAVAMPVALLTSLEGRTFLWRAAWPMFFEHPVFGSGLGVFQLRFPDLQAKFLSSHPEYSHYWTFTSQLHNDPLQFLLETGIVGFAILVWVFLAYGKDVRGVMASASREQRVWLAASAGGLASLMVNAIFNFQFAIPPTLILIFTFLSIPGMLNRAANPGTNKSIGVVLRVAVSVFVAGAALWLVAGIATRAVADHSLALGLDQEQRGNYGVAEQHFREGLNRDKQNPALHYGLARALYIQEKYAEALNSAQEADRNLSDPHLEVLHARIHDRLGHARVALAMYRRALELDPSLNSVRADIERLLASPAL